MLRAVRVIGSESLEEFARPGLRAERESALALARAAVAGLSHPVSREIARALTGEAASSASPLLIKALAAVALHADAGDTLAARVFSTRYLGDSKALSRVRTSVESVVGALEALGIREGAALTLLGGSGRLHVSGQVLSLAQLAPYVGLARDTVLSLEQVEFPEAGLLVVENLTAFEACCRGEVDPAHGTLVLWSAGYPGRGVRRVVVEAATRRAPVRVWADLDLDGVRIARLVSSWAPEDCGPLLMSPQDLRSAPASRPLSTRAAAAIASDLNAQPDALLSGTLRSILEMSRWVEQEALLGR
jgi:hypothetical protein